VLAPDQVQLLAQAADEPTDAALWSVAAFTGLRMGELLALQWSDVDWDKRLLHVRRSYTGGHLGTPKSGRVRSVQLVDQAAPRPRAAV
jgi:integrase